MTRMVEIDAFIQTDTEKAMLVSEEKLGTLSDVWVPKSQCRLVETSPDGRSRIALPEWLVVRKGLDGLVVAEAEDDR